MKVTGESERNRMISKVRLFLFLTVAFVPGLLSAESEEITVWAMGEEGNRISVLAQAFESENPGVRVVTQAIPWNGAHDRLLTAVAGGLTPDVVQLGTTWIPEFAEIDALLPLDSLIGEGEIGAERFYPGSWKTALYDDRVVSIPWYVDTRVYFYRSDLLEDAGIGEFPRTWQGLEELGEALTRDVDGDGTFDNHAYDLLARDYGLSVALFRQAGASIFGPDGKSSVASVEGIESLSFFRSLVSRGYAPGPSGRQIDPIQDLRTGYVASWISGPWMVELLRTQAPDLNGKWMVAGMPRGRHESSFLGGCNLAVFRNSTRPNLAQRFVVFCSRPDIQQLWFSATGNLPAVRDAWNAEELENDPIWRVFKNQLESAEPPPPLVSWAAMESAIENSVEDMVINERNPAETARELASRLDSLYPKGRRGKGNLSGHGTLVLGGFFVFFAVIVALWVLAPALLDRTSSWRRVGVSAMFLAPAALHLIVFMLVPLMISLALSFTNYDIYSIGDWRTTSFVGFENYQRLVGDARFWTSFLNTVYFLAVAGPLTIIAALTAAIILNRRFSSRVRTFFRSSLFLPVVTPLVAVAVVWRWLLAPQSGLINLGLEWIGIEGRAWLTDPVWAMPSLILMAVWKNAGYSMVIFLAGLQTIPRTFYEAAEVDGAGPMRRFVSITIPLLRPTLLFVVVVTTIGYMQLFAEPYVMTAGGGPSDRTLSIVLYLYQEGFKFFNLGYASAVAYTLCLVVAVVSFLQMILAGSREGRI